MSHLSPQDTSDHPDIRRGSADLAGILKLGRTRAAAITVVSQSSSGRGDPKQLTSLVLSRDWPPSWSFRMIGPERQKRSPPHHGNAVASGLQGNACAHSSLWRPECRHQLSAHMTAPWGAPRRVSRADVEGKRTHHGQMSLMNGPCSVSDCFRRILAAHLGNGPVAIRTDPPSRTHRNSRTGATTSGKRSRPIRTARSSWVSSAIAAGACGGNKPRSLIKFWTASGVFQCGP